MIRRPPRSTLFPTRRSSDLRAPSRCLAVVHARAEHRGQERPRPMAWTLPGKLRGPLIGRGRSCPRSEEHTSELQSRLHLVCRLLLEKKKKKYNQTHTTHMVT